MSPCLFVVVDHLPTRDRICGLARAVGYGAMDGCSTAEEALARVSTVSPDVIVLDLRSPGDIDGLELLRRLRQQEPAATLIACGSFDDSHHMESVFRAGADRCIAKPFRSDDMCRLLEVVAMEAGLVA